MLSQLLSGNFTIQTIIAEILAVLVIIFLILPFHEWAHAQTAYLLGDKGIKQRGRLSLNPLSHIDPVGALAMLFIGFGWAKPVPVDARYFKNPKVGMAITAFMGPVANLIAHGTCREPHRCSRGTVCFPYAVVYSTNVFHGRRIRQLRAGVFAVLYHCKRQPRCFQPSAHTAARRFKDTVRFPARQGGNVLLPLPDVLHDRPDRAAVGRPAQLRADLPFARRALWNISVLDSAVPAFRTEHGSV